MTFTPRETEVVKALADGLTWKDAAASLNMSTSTLRQHVDSMARKIRVVSGAPKTDTIVRYYRLKHPS